MMMMVTMPLNVASTTIFADMLMMKTMSMVTVLTMMTRMIKTLHSRNKKSIKSRRTLITDSKPTANYISLLVRAIPPPKKGRREEP